MYDSDLDLYKEICDALRQHHKETRLEKVATEVLAALVARGDTNVWSAAYKAIEHANELLDQIDDANRLDTML